MCIDDPIIDSFETLYADAKTRMVTEQGQQLLLTYGESLLRRRDARVMMLEEMRDEIAIALALRAPPIVFWIDEEKFIGSKVVPITPAPSIATVKLSGGRNNVCTLRGEITSFGTQRSAMVAAIPGRSEKLFQ
jgi:hypothetical protein